MIPPGLGGDIVSCAKDISFSENVKNKIKPDNTINLFIRIFNFTRIGFLKISFGMVNKNSILIKLDLNSILSMPGRGVYTFPVCQIIYYMSDIVSIF